MGSRKDMTGSAELADAINRDDEAAVAAAVRAGADPDHVYSDSSRMRGAHYCALKGHANALRGLITSGASLNVTDAGGQTPLTTAAQLGHVGCVELLLVAGADPSLRRGKARDALAAAEKAAEDTLGCEDDYRRVIAALRAAGGES